MDSGVPQTSKRTASRPAGGVAKTAGAKVKPAEAKAKPGDAKTSGAKSTGNGAPRQGPVDPRTEDPSAPLGIARAGKTLWRRPGVLTPHTELPVEAAVPATPIEFSVAMPLAPVVPEAPVARATDTGSNVWVVSETTALAPAVVLPPTELSVIPSAFVPTELVPDVPPTEPVVAAPAVILYDQAATIDDVTQIGPVLESRPLLRPIQFRRAPKPRVRRVTRVVRHVDTWSVFKVAFVFSVFFYAVALVAGVLLWQVAYATGTIDNVEKFFEGFGWETFKFNGGQIYHNAWIAGLFVAVGLTGLAVLMATLFNLITDLVGGIRLSVLEEEVRSRAERGTQPAQVTPAQPVTEPASDDLDPAPAAAAPLDPTMPVEYG
ncbi:MAG: DUF3566 domain-containing protein [Ilumatobacteraceae bacterium]